MRDFDSYSIEQLTKLAVDLRDAVDFELTEEHACAQKLELLAQYKNVVEELEHRNAERADTDPVT